MIKRTKGLAAALATMGLVLAAFVPAFQSAQANHDPFDGTIKEKVNICHATGNGYNDQPDVSISSIVGGTGHGGHDGDIIPPFHYMDGESTLSYSGKNWSASNEELWNNNCGNENDDDGNDENDGDDVCLNIEGDQEKVPEGFIRTDLGNCFDEDDVCRNLDGVQTEPPSGYHFNEAHNECIPDAPQATSTIKVIKWVVNDDGGTATTSDFTLYVGNANGTTTVISGVATIFSPGTYFISEEASSTYEMSYTDGACSSTHGYITLAAGQDKTCIITNNDIPASTSTPTTTPETADVSVTKTVSTTTPSEGDSIVFTITATNHGPASTTGLVLADLLPSYVTFASASTTAGAYSTTTGNWTIGTLLNGETATLELTTTVNSDTAGQTFNNSVNVTGSNVTDPDTSNNSTTTPNITVTSTSTPDTTNEVTTPTNPPRRRGGGNFIQGGGQVLGAQTGEVLGDSCGLYMDRFVRRGRTNNAEQVLKLQAFLNKHMGSNLPLTGFYGPMTEGAVKAFQQKYAAQVLTPWGLTAPTGIVYQTTLRWINLIECPDLALQIPSLVEWSKNPSVNTQVYSSAVTVAQ